MFKNNKYTIWYFKIVQAAAEDNRVKFKNIYYESHHIIPKSLGGTEQVLLTAKEHYICHLLLCKMLDGPCKYKMINALSRMSFSKSNNQERYTSNSYALVRKFLAERNKYLFKGVLKSHNMKLKLSKTRTGMKFSDSHKFNLSQAQKKRTENGFKGKKHSDETKEKWSHIRKGISPSFNAKGTKWFTDGKIDKMCIPGMEPIGFILGRSKSRKEFL